MSKHKPVDTSKTNAQDRPLSPCVHCGKLALKEHYPFCSERCRSIDLHRWFSGSYVLPGSSIKGEEEE